MSSGKEWQVLRRFTMQALRDFGVGKKSIEEKIQGEATALIKELEKLEGKPQDASIPTQRAVTNIICSIIFGDR